MSRFELHDRRALLLSGLVALAVCASAAVSWCAAEEPAGDPPVVDEPPDLTVLSPTEWNEIDTAVDRALDFIARNQQPDGSFTAPMDGQPGITSLCVMAFLSRGHVPGQGPYGRQIERAIDFTLATQQANGLISSQGADNSGNVRPNYNHAIAGLMLGEVYGMTDGRRSQRIAAAIVRALAFSRKLQLRAKRHPRDNGGWRYIVPWGPNDSDLSATSWQLMFYRSAKNAAFDVSTEYIDDAMAYVRRCFDSQKQAFVYALEHGPDRERYASGGVVGGGIVSLAMAGEHHTKMARAAGQWILQHPFDQYNRRGHREDRYHYSAFYCSQAMFQLGGEFWEKFYPPFARTLLDNQRSDGSWERERIRDGQFGNVYTTALVVLALTPPYQLLPIYQR